MKQLVSLIIIVIFFSCRSSQDKRCEKNFIGIWRVDTIGLHISYKKIIEEKNWLNLKLIADSNGTFRLNSTEKDLKQCEGNWYAKYNSEDAGCILNYKEHYYKGYISTNGFHINGIFEDSTQFSIPFKKE